MRSLSWLLILPLLDSWAYLAADEIPPLPEVASPYVSVLEEVSFDEEEIPLPDSSSELSDPVPKSSPKNKPSGELIDLRPPELPTLDSLLTDCEPHWVNDVIDDHLLIWRQVRSEVDVVPRGGTGFGMTTLGFKANLFSTDGPLWGAVFFGWNFLNGPRTPDVPAQTYDLGLEVNLAQQIDDRWGVHLQFAPLYSSDFNNKTSDGFRFTGGGLVTFQADDVTKLVAGLSFLDRPDLNLLPIAGLKWMITENLELDALVPRPRLSWRFDGDETSSHWLYLGGDVGGGSWAIEEVGNRKTRLGYRDLRFLLGVETSQIDGGRHVVEAGYVFNRRLDFSNGPGDQHLDPTWVIRWGSTY